MGLEVNGVEIIKSRQAFKEAQLGLRGAAYGKDQRWKGSAAGCAVYCLSQRVRPASGQMEAGAEDRLEFVKEMVLPKKKGFKVEWERRKLRWSPSRGGGGGRGRGCQFSEEVISTRVDKLFYLIILKPHWPLLTVYFPFPCPVPSSCTLPLHPFFSPLSQ